MPRVTPIAEKSQVPAEHHAIVDGVLEVFGSIRGPHSILLLTPQLDERVLKLGNYFRYDSIVKPKEGELAVMAVAREKDCPYVWAAHVAAGRRAGVREEAIDVVRARRDPSALAPDEAAIVSYVQQLLRNNRVEQRVFDALKDRYGVEWIIELTALMGNYGLLAGVVNAFEVPAPVDADQLPV